MRIARSFASTLALVALATAASAQPEPYIVVPPPLPGDRWIAVADVSGDGRRVVGRSILASVHTAVFWDDLGPATPLAPGDVYGTPIAISSDGTTVVGRYALPTVSPPFLWTEATGAVTLPDLENPIRPAEASGISVDGSTVLGNVWVPSPSVGSQALAARWDDGVLSIFKPDGHPDGLAGSLWDMSATGLVVGSGEVWDGTALVTSVEVPGLTDCGVRAISRDGTVWAGSCSLEATPWSWVPVRWSGEGSSLASLTETYVGEADGVSADGSVVVGSVYEGPARRPFVWTAVDGFRFLEDRLEAAGVDTSAVPLDAVWSAAVSDDGRTVVGQGFIARIPEPQPVPEPAAALAGVAVLVALARISAWRSYR